MALHGAPGPVVVRCAFQAKLGELVGDKVCSHPGPCAWHACMRLARPRQCGASVVAGLSVDPGVYVTGSGMGNARPRRLARPV